MSSLTVRGATRIQTVGWANLTAPHCMLLAASQTTLPSRQTNTVSEVDEFSGTGYTGGFGGSGRQALASMSVSEDDSNQRVELTCAAVSFSSISTGRAAPIAAIIEEITNDAGSNVISLQPYRLTSSERVPTSASEASPASINTSAAHGLTTGEVVYIEGFAGGTWGANVNGRAFKVTVVDSDTFTVDGLNSSAFGTATFATAKIYVPVTMNGATLTLTPGADGIIRGNVAQAAETA